MCSPVISKHIPRDTYTSKLYLSSMFFVFLVSHMSCKFRRSEKGKKEGREEQTIPIFEKLLHMLYSIYFFRVSGYIPFRLWFLAEAVKEKVKRLNNLGKDEVLGIVSCWKDIYRYMWIRVGRYDGIYRATVAIQSARINVGHLCFQKPQNVASHHFKCFKSMFRLSTFQKYVDY